ncbi:MAG TPA: hypothetical protein V6D19_24620, partial [Stenomitos sp.]
LRLPRRIVRRLIGATPETLMDTFLEWRAQVMQDLGVSVIPGTDIEDYFARSQHNFAEMRHRLLCSSIIGRMFDMAVYRLHPQQDWLGEYARVKVRTH